MFIILLDHCCFCVSLSDRAPTAIAKQQTFGVVGFTSPLHLYQTSFRVRLHYFTLTDMTQRSRRDSLTSADGAPTGLFSHPEIKPSAAGPLLHC